MAFTTAQVNEMLAEAYKEGEATGYQRGLLEASSTVIEQFQTYLFDAMMSFRAEGDAAQLELPIAGVVTNGSRPSQPPKSIIRKHGNRKVAADAVPFRIIAKSLIEHGPLGKPLRAHEWEKIAASLLGKPQLSSGGVIHHVLRTIKAAGAMTDSGEGPDHLWTLESRTINVPLEYIVWRKDRGSKDPIIIR